MAVVLFVRNSRNLNVTEKLEVDPEKTSISQLKTLASESLKLPSLSGHKFIYSAYLHDPVSLHEEDGLVKDNQIVKDLVSNQSSIFVFPPPDPSQPVRRKKADKSKEPEISVSDNFDDFTMEIKDIVKVLEKTTDKKKRRAIIYFGCKKAKDFIETKALESASKETLVAFLSDDQFAVEEGAIFDILLKWAKKKAGKDDITEVKKILTPELLSIVRFPLMTTAEVATKVVPSGLLEMQQTLDLFAYTGAVSALKDKDKKGPPLGKSIEKMNNKPRKPIRIEFEWTPYSSVQISDNNRTVTATTMACHIVTGSISFTKGKHEWKVRVLANGAHISIGVVGPSVSRTQGYIGNSSDGWSLNEDGRTEHQGSYHNNITTGSYSSLQVGDVVEVSLDMDNKQISWKNGNVTWAPIAITLGEVFPAVMVYNRTSLKLEF